MNDKRELRKLIKVKRDALEYKYITEAGEEMSRILLESELFQNARTVFTYINMKDEPSTEKLIEETQRLGKTLCVPVCHKNGLMDAVKVNESTVLGKGFHGITEPLGEHEIILPEETDLVIVPCVSANLSGYRLGHGWGYYDIFLAKTKAPRVCLCFSELLCKDIPTEPHDIRMDYILTENGLAKITPGQS